MRETNFIQQNQEKWKDFEQSLQREQQDPDKLKEIFIQTTDDLSFARTFYPNRSVRVYLNALSQRIFSKIYRNKQSKRGRILSFFKTELPLLMWEARSELRLAFILFAVAILIGMISCHADNDFVRVILGEQYVEMTKSNIANGDPMAVYKDESAFGMFLGITANNIFVSFLAFLLGITYVGTIGLLIRNGVMLGAFQYFFVEYGLFQESFLTVWMHGALEISAIVLAGAAGLTMGRGIMFPGTLSRMKSFQISARRGIKIMLGIMPMFFAAGFIESYLTRHTEVPDVFRALFIFTCFVYVFGYFIWYPRYLVKQGALRNLPKEPIPHDSPRQINVTSIQENGSIFTDIFVFYRKNLKQLAFVSLAAAIIYCTFIFLTTNQYLGDIFYFPYTQLNAIGPLQTLFAIFSGSTLWEIGQFFYQSNLPILIPINIVCFSLLMLTVFQLLKKSAKQQMNIVDEKRTTFKSSLIDFLKIGFIVTAIYLIILTKEVNVGLTFLSIFAAFPLLLLSGFITIWEEKNVFSSIGKAFHLLSGQYGQLLKLFGILSITAVAFFLLFDTAFVVFIFEFIGLNFSLEQTAMDVLAIIILTFMVMFLIFLISMMMMAGFGLIYFSLVETKEAIHLKDSIQYIGSGKKIRGLERE